MGYDRSADGRLDRSADGRLYRQDIDAETNIVTSEFSQRFLDCLTLGIQAAWKRSVSDIARRSCCPGLRLFPAAAPAPANPGPTTPPRCPAPPPPTVLSVPYGRLTVERH